VDEATLVASDMEAMDQRILALRQYLDKAHSTHSADKALLAVAGMEAMDRCILALQQYLDKAHSVF
jgi:hypothetical protein